MYRYQLTVAYKGTRYSGWQIQKNARSVQEEIYKALNKIGFGKSKVTGSGRTDAGVHAKGQVVLIEGDKSFSPVTLKKALNANLPDDIRILQASLASEGFHPLRNAKQKTYIYRVRSSDVPSPFTLDYEWQIPYSLDLNQMRRCAFEYVGKHDFKAYCASGSSVKTTERTIFRFEVNQEDSDFGKVYTFTVTGDGFLYNMVRIMVGTLVQAGQGRISPDQIKKSLISGNRKDAGPTAPPQGLILDQVVYK